MRHAPFPAAVVIGFACTLAAGCLGEMPSPDSPTRTGGGGAVVDTPTPDAGVAAADLATSADMTPAAAQPDLRSTDLAGLTDCFGVTVCDPTMEFCIRLDPGSAANPGTPARPACYQPVDCMGANMNCDCITQDPVLSQYCANCVDHADGTFDCYAQQ